jgi:ureidoacrylate peracid hydrolase
MHTIVIPDSVIAQVKAQRGRLNRYDRLIGEKTALVVMCLEGQATAWSVFFEGDPRREMLSELTPGARGFELYAGLDVKPDDAVIVKKRYSAFIQGSSDIDRQLREAGIDTVVIVGTLTNVCCESSARDAMM